MSKEMTLLFGLTSLLPPLYAGVFRVFPGVFGVAASYGFFLILKLVSGTSVGTGIPTLFSGLVWYVLTDDNPSPAAQLSLFFFWPFTAFYIFIDHPNTGHAYGFAAYWGVISVCFMLSLFIKNRVLRTALYSLITSFSAHTVGTILYLHMYPSTEAMWSNLIPVVPAERLGVAAAMFVAGLLLQQLPAFLAAPEPEKKKSKRYRL